MNSRSIVERAAAGHRLLRPDMMACCQWLWLLMPLIALSKTDAADVDYVRDIKPMLKAKCFSCHGGITQESGLRLDTASLITQGGDSGPAAVAGQPDASEMLHRVTTTDLDQRMPPEGEPLTPAQIARLRRWIHQGAEGPADEQPQSDPSTHWAFQPLRQVVPPVGFDHPIDAFIGKRLATANLTSAAPARSSELVRRLFLDLHGLPPRPDQVASWSQQIIEDHSQLTVLIDRLLSSPRYGERMAQHWLDIVRYADTHGYEVNTPRPNAWPYRDYVIDAFNRDTPYDQFIVQQLAGDAIDADAATGFLVAAAALLPGQIGKDDASIRLARQDALDEIIVGTGATFLGITIGCARCHDHKFDPITQQDYYAMQAFFAGVEYGDREIHDNNFRRRVAQANSLQGEIDRLESQLNQLHVKPYPGQTLIIDDEDLDRVTLLKTKQGHGTNPAGEQRGYRDDTGNDQRMPNLSRGRYTWWQADVGEDVFSWNPKVDGHFRLWVSWGVHGSGVHTREARYLLDQDGNLSTTDDQQEIARADQYYFSGVSQGVSDQKPLWSGLLDTGIHQFRKTSRLILRNGEVAAGITADVIVMQEAGEESAIPQRRLPSLRAPVSPSRTIEHLLPKRAKFLRFTSLATIDDNKHEPCLDELEVFSTEQPSRNIALASEGTRATSSGNYSDSGKHQLPHINDGRYGNSRSWISNQHGRGWVQLEFPEAQLVDRVEWGRDREGKFKDRLPWDYEISVSADGQDWTKVASDDDRLPQGTPFDQRSAIVRGASSHFSKDRADELLALANRLRLLQQRQQALRSPQLVFGGTFREPDKTFVLDRGNPERPTREVGPQVIAALGNLPLSKDSNEQNRRIRLAHWIASAENPLTARVMVNRIWQWHLGVGLVETASDFGLSGAPPSHPDLLDWLSSEFIRSGWSIKHIHRLIVSSSTYQQSTNWSGRQQSASVGTGAVVADPAIVDSDCQLLWRFPSRRMEAEVIRDSMLQVSGQLNLEAGGSGFDFFKSRGGLSGFPPVEEFSADGYRRMIYAHKIRMEQVPVFGVFDCPDAGLPTPRRSQSTTALQALNLMNSPFVVAQAEIFAGRIEAAGTDQSTAAAIATAYRLALGRPPTSGEQAIIEPVVREHGLATLCRALFNSNEFLFLP